MSNGLEYAPPDPSVRRKRLIKQILIIVGCVGVLGLSVCGYGAHRAMKGVAQVHCSIDLRQLGQAIALYAQDHEGNLPPDMETLYRSKNLGLDGCICPATEDVAPKVPGDLARPGHFSYVYVGAGLTKDSPSDSVMLIEDPDNHDEGGHIVYVDGVVDLVSPMELMHAFNELRQGNNRPGGSVTLRLQKIEDDFKKNIKPNMAKLKTGEIRFPATRPATAPA